MSAAFARVELRLRAGNRNAVGLNLGAQLASGFAKLLFEQIVLLLRGRLVSEGFVIGSPIFIQLLARQTVDLDRALGLHCKLLSLFASQAERPRAFVRPERAARRQKVQWMRRRGRQRFVLRSSR